MRTFLTLAAAGCFLLAALVLLIQGAQPAVAPNSIVETPITGAYPAPGLDGTVASDNGYVYVGEPFVYNPSLDTYELPASHEGGFNVCDQPGYTCVGEPFVFGQPTEPATPPDTTTPQPKTNDRGPGTKLVVRPVYVDSPPEGCTPITIKFSWYFPNLVYKDGYNPNCSRYDYDKKWCVSKTSSKAPWEQWLGDGAAMSMDVSFGSLVLLKDNQGWRQFTVVDRGGAIIKSGSAYWVDILTKPGDRANFPYSYGQKVSACLVRK